MATNNHFSNYENLFSAYRDSVSTANNASANYAENELNLAKKQLEVIEEKLKDIITFLKNPTKKLNPIDTRKSQEFKSKVRNAEQELANLKSSINTNPELTRQYALGNLRFEENRFLKTTAEIINLETIINNPETESKEKTTAKGKLTKAKKLLSTINENLAKYENLIKISDQQIAQIAQAQQKLDDLVAKQQAILKDEEIYRRKASNENSSIEAEIQSQKIKQKELIVEKNKLKKEIEQLEKNVKAVPTNTTGSIESFKQFLVDNNFSTVHADELYELYKKPNHKLTTLTKNEFKLRKQHPKRDKFLKKFVVPTAITAGAVGTAFGAIAASNLIAGSKWLFVTITSNPAVNFLSAALPGAAIGAVAAVATIKVKDWLTKAHYNIKYGNAEKILKDPESVKLDELIEKIENTKDDILDLRTGNNNIFSKFGRAIKRTFKNVVNRNRIHHIEAVTEKLVEKFNEINSNPEYSIDTKLKLTTPICEVLQKINSFFSKDIKKSKIFAMLNCKETDKNHSHKETIENLDIYSKLSMYLEKIENENLSASTKKKVHSEVKSDLKKQNIVAERLLNGEDVTNLVTKKYLQLVKASDKINTPTSKIINSYLVLNGELKVTYNDGKSSTYQVENAEDIKKVESVNLGKTLLITYKNGEQASISSSIAKQKINLNVAGEFKIYDKLLESSTIDYLVEQKGINKDTILEFMSALKSTKFNKNGKEKAKPNAFMKSKAYKENPEYAKIIEEVNAIIKNPNIVNINYGFNS